MGNPTDVLEEIVSRVVGLPEDSRLMLHTMIFRQLRISKSDYINVMKNPEINAQDKQMIQTSYEGAETALINVNIPESTRNYEKYTRMMKHYGIIIPGIPDLLDNKPRLVPSRSA